jgi:hypothetical protein
LLLPPTQGPRFVGPSTISCVSCGVLTCTWVFVDASSSRSGVLLRVGVRVSTFTQGRTPNLMVLLTALHASGDGCMLVFAVTTQWASPVVPQHGRVVPLQAGLSIAAQCYHIIRCVIPTSHQRSLSSERLPATGSQWLLALTLRYDTPCGMPPSHHCLLCPCTCTASFRLALRAKPFVACCCAAPYVCTYVWRLTRETVMLMLMDLWQLAPCKKTRSLPVLLV